MEKFWISHSFTTPNVKLSYKNHWHQMGGAALYHCDGIPKTIAGCSNDWNKGTKCSRPWIIERELPYYREFQGCTVAYVQKCQVTPDSLFAEINHYNWPVSHFNVVMSGSATFKDAILVVSSSPCSEKPNGGLRKSRPPTQPIQKSRLEISTSASHLGSTTGGRDSRSTQSYHQRPRCCRP